MRLFDLRDEVMRLDVSPSALVEEWSKDVKDKVDVQCSFYETAADVPDPRDLSSTNKNLMIFDDLLLEKQNKCESYYIRGRHSNVDCFYLSQNYFKLPRQTIRENANFICLFPQDLKNINHIYADHVSQDMPKDEFRKLCKTAWENPHGFVTIDLTSKTSADGDYQIDFRPTNSISSLLGFNNEVFMPGSHDSTKVVNILAVNSILVNVDVISGSYVNGYKIVETPVNLVYLPITLDTIYSLESKVTDQDGKLLNLRDNAADAGKVVIDKLSWYMPHVMPADAEKFQLYKTIEAKSSLPVGYRMRQCDTVSVAQTTNFAWRLGVKSSPERPRYIIVGFQTNKEGDQEQNSSIFDNINVTSMHALLNSKRYPDVDYRINFTKQQFSRVYSDASFRSKFYHMDELVSNPNITPGVIDPHWVTVTHLLTVMIKSH
ncbi:hypothetical protein CAPTEDRAFT_186306 [Capitella teleta]|uniref:Double jelly roll-like domain-containing protein n=1 Tax=Capitella teleta TaxID=283909 RepID=R7TIV3_CAPTE|nr:hypothetical protein CAPTEDRAFT_186306 [Capitella teleta]|eukprot:ELT91025.1 hypothetical protein CAPTEDRAFT_186306 [Capitella teleta]